jgi:hypothetical protein
MFGIDAMMKSMGLDVKTVQQQAVDFMEGLKRNFETIQQNFTVHGGRLDDFDTHMDAVNQRIDLLESRVLSLELDMVELTGTNPHIDLRPEAFLEPDRNV